jgi:hypothetical protein
MNLLWKEAAPTILWLKGRGYTWCLEGANQGGSGLAYQKSGTLLLYG